MQLTSAFTCNWKNNVVLATKVDPRATKGEEQNGAGDFMWGLVFGDGRFRGSCSGLVFGMSMSGEIRGPDSGRYLVQSRSRVKFGGNISLDDPESWSTMILSTFSSSSSSSSSSTGTSTSSSI